MQGDEEMIEMYDNRKIRRGEIYYVYQQEITGSEIGGGRPAIVVSNDEQNSYLDFVVVVYLTTKEKRDEPIHVPIKSSRLPSIALCEQITTVSKKRIGDFLNTVSMGEMKNVVEGIKASLSLECMTKAIMPERQDKSEPSQQIKEDISKNPEYVKAATERDVYKKMYFNLLRMQTSQGGASQDSKDNEPSAARK